MSEVLITEEITTEPELVAEVPVKKTTTRKKTSTKKTAAKAAEISASEVVEPAKTKPIIPKDIDPSMMVTVRSGVHGILNYKSKRTGESYRWNEFGTEQEMELRELRSAKSSYKDFFRNNLFMFDEDWIPEYLGVRQYYKNALPIDSFDDIFTKKPSELKEIVSKLSDGQKKSVAYRARQLIKEGTIDSLSLINTLEEVLDTDLIEK